MWMYHIRGHDARIGNITSFYLQKVNELFRPLLESKKSAFDNSAALQYLEYILLKHCLPINDIVIHTITYFYFYNISKILYTRIGTKQNIFLIHSLL